MISDGLPRKYRKAALASVSELESREFTGFMALLNQLAEKFGLRIMTNWSKVWEYPWLWFNALESIQIRSSKICDLGSELSSVPWYLASLGDRKSVV